MSKNPPSHVVGPYRCRGVQQAATYVRMMITEKSANSRARLASHVLPLLSDMDKATLEGAKLGEIADEQAGLLKLIEETGIVLIPTNQDEPLSLGGEE